LSGVGNREVYPIFIVTHALGVILNQVDIIAYFTAHKGVLSQYRHTRKVLNKCPRKQNLRR
jgi:hypothetical protein